MRNHSNLIPSRTQRKSAAIYIVRRWLVVCACTLVITTTACLAWRYDSLAFQDQLDDLSTESSKAESELLMANTLRQRRAALDDSLSKLTSLSNTRVPPTVFALFCASTSQLPSRMRLEDFSIREMPVIDAEHSSIQGFQIQVSGSAKDDAAIQDFVDGLKQTELFNAVELKSTHGVSNTSGESRQFQVHCQLIVDVAERLAETTLVGTANPTPITSSDQGD